MGQADTIYCKELLVLLRKITQAIDLHSKHLYKKFGLTGPQLIILQELSKGEMTVSGLARAISLSQGTVTDIIHRLEKKELIIKKRSSEDKRSVLISLSEKCRTQLTTAPSPLQEKFTDSFSKIPEWEKLMLLSSVSRIAEMMSAGPLAAQPRDKSTVNS